MAKKKIDLKLVRELKLGQTPSVGVKAASGLVKSGKMFFVIADDQLSLVQFDFEDTNFMQTFPLRSGFLPLDEKKRKQQKPDWESLIKINTKNDQNLLLAIPSGSTVHRTMGAYATLDKRGRLSEDTETNAVDFSKVYSELSENISDLNIEGACLYDRKLKLFQRGNGRSQTNAVIDIEFDGFCEDLIFRRSINPKNIGEIHKIDLGELTGVKLGFTDACVVKDRIWFIAAAEASHSTYDDGEFRGGILGCLDPSGTEIERYTMNCATKPEGLWVEAEGDKLCFYIVTDADSSKIYASLYYGELALKI